MSIGLFIEPAADCAVRELKEETGIKLDADEVKNSPQVDLLQTDNFNPHKGNRKWLIILPSINVYVTVMR